MPARQAKGRLFIGFDHVRGSLTLRMQLCTYNFTKNSTTFGARYATDARRDARAADALQHTHTAAYTILTNFYFHR